MTGPAGRPAPLIDEEATPATSAAFLMPTAPALPLSFASTLRLCLLPLPSRVKESS